MEPNVKPRHFGCTGVYAKSRVHRARQRVKRRDYAEVTTMKRRHQFLAVDHSWNCIA
jgi:hypothetical protein